ncbi:MAG: FHA domain-containing protein [Deltaproteobacteria bacterium]|nr:FHA domain-containing protein [Deltaproteobacteria bacterium]
MCLYEDGAPDPPFVEDAKKQAHVMVVQTEGIEPMRYALLGNSFTIGRTEEANIPLRSKRISRNHAVLTRKNSTASFYIEDEGSQNGTWINGERMRKKMQLKVGDNVWIPPYHLHLAQHEVAVPTPSSKGKLQDDNPFVGEDNASLLLRGADLGAVSGRSLAAAKDAWSDHLANMDQEEKMWEGGTDVEPLSFPRPGQSFEDTSKAKEKSSYEPGMAIFERDGHRLAEIHMNRPIVVVGDTPECDVVLRSGDFPVGPQLVLCPSHDGDLAVVQLFERQRPAVVVRNGRSVEIADITISFSRDS